MAKPVTHQYLVEEFRLYNPPRWVRDLVALQQTRMSVIVARTLGMLEQSLQVEWLKSGKMRSAILHLQIDASLRLKVENLVDPDRIVNKKMGQRASQKRDNPPYNSYGFLSVEDGADENLILVRVRLLERIPTGGSDRKGNPKYKRETLAVTTGLQQLIESYLRPSGLEKLPAELSSGVCQEIGQELMSHVLLADSGQVDEANFPTVEQRDPSLRMRTYLGALSRSCNRVTDFNRVPYPELYPERYARIQKTNPALAERLSQRLLVVDEDWDTVRRKPIPPQFPLFFVTSAACQVFAGSKDIKAGIAKADRHRGIASEEDAGRQALAVLTKALKLLNKKTKSPQAEQKRKSQVLNLVAPYGVKPEKGQKLFTLRPHIKRLLKRAREGTLELVTVRTDSRDKGKEQTRARQHFVALPLIAPDDEEAMALCPRLNGKEAPKTGRGWDFGLKSLPIWGEEPYRPHTGKRKVISHRVLVPIDNSADQRRRILENSELTPCWSRLVSKHDGQLYWQLTYKVGLPPAPVTDRVLGVHLGLHHLHWVLLDTRQGVLAKGVLRGGEHLKRHLEEALSRESMQRKGRWVGGRKVQRALRTDTHQVIGRIIALAKRNEARICIEEIKWVDKKRGSTDLNKRHSGWNFGQLKRFLEYKAPLLGCGPVLFCSDYVVNLTCPSCGAMRQAKQKPETADTYLDRQSGELHCRKCDSWLIKSPEQKAETVARWGSALLSKQR
jgi:IS605 OrfB family transposase